VVDVHGFVDPPIDVHRGRGNGVVVIPSKRSREGIRRIDHLLLGVEWLHNAPM
jgi:hypothetical protein